MMLGWAVVTHNDWVRLKIKEWAWSIRVGDKMVEQRRTMSATMMTVVECERCETSVAIQHRLYAIALSMIILAKGFLHS